MPDCYALPAMCFICPLSLIALGTVLNLLFPRFVCAMFGKDPDDRSNIEFCRLTGVIGIVALLCFFYFMYPDQVANSIDQSRCSSTIYPLGK